MASWFSKVTLQDGCGKFIRRVTEGARGTEVT